MCNTAATSATTTASAATPAPASPKPVRTGSGVESLARIRSTPPGGGSRSPNGDSRSVVIGDYVLRLQPLAQQCERAVSARSDRAFLDAGHCSDLTVAHSRELAKHEHALQPLRQFVDRPLNSKREHRRTAADIVRRLRQG